MAATDFSSLRDEYDNFLRQEVSLVVSCWCMYRTDELDRNMKEPWIDSPVLTMFLSMFNLSSWRHAQSETLCVFPTSSDSITSIASAP